MMIVYTGYILVVKQAYAGHSMLCTWKLRWPAALKIVAKCKWLHSREFCPKGLKLSNMSSTSVNNLDEDYFLSWGCTQRQKSHNLHNSTHILKFKCWSSLYIEFFDHVECGCMCTVRVRVESTLFWFTFPCLLIQLHVHNNGLKFEDSVDENLDHKLCSNCSWT